MKTFLEFAQNLINEMPYFHYEGSDRQEHDFDYELEKRSFSDLSALLLHVFKGGAVRDKYGNVMKLETPEEKQQLLDDLLNPKGMFIINSMVRYNKEINPIVRNERMPTDKRTPEEIEAFRNWIGEIVKKSSRNNINTNR